MDYVLSCSSTCDLDREMLRENNIEFACFKYIIDGKEYEDNFYQSYDYRKFYEDISNGMKPTTSQVGYGDYIEFFEKFLKEGKDVLYIDLSSGISGDYNTLKMVVEELNEKYENKIYAVDSLCASSGQGMLVMYAAENRKNGMSIEDNYKWCEDNKLNIQHWFIST
ncbi:MAG: DegV family protein, partial [Solobacterium sp.]|nr:DegV family protein [Solobacterium sp.]